MDHKEFIERLSELADIKVTKAPTNSGESIARLEPVFVERNGKVIEILPTNNPTWNIVVKKLKPIIKECEDCGKLVKDRRVNKSMYTFPKSHWRKNCNGCLRTQNPETGKFDIPFTHAAAFFTSFIKKQDK